MREGLSLLLFESVGLIGYIKNILYVIWNWIPWTGRSKIWKAWKLMFQRTLGAGTIVAFTWLVRSHYFLVWAKLLAKHRVLSCPTVKASFPFCFSTAFGSFNNCESFLQKSFILPYLFIVLLELMLDMFQWYLDLRRFC